MFEDIYLRKKAVPEKLESYGFQKTPGGYRYRTNILDGAFQLEITVGKGIMHRLAGMKLRNYLRM